MARRRSGKKIDTTRWVGAFGGTAGTGLSAGTLGVALLSSATLAETIMRFRGTLLAYMDAAGAPLRGVRVSVGLILVPEGTGSTVLWSPFTDENAPWFYYSSFVLAYEEMVIDVVDVPQASGYREVIDNKAMRIIRPDTEVQMVVENTTLAGAGAASINVELSGRILLGR